ncbi:hypothetical protein HDV03_000525 [Kappamyces sp. JEL0829]|nr:hypothetical protein HDV03_000525 [Kappamyces sp. JEL0829]
MPKDEPESYRRNTILDVKKYATANPFLGQTVEVVHPIYYQDASRVLDQAIDVAMHGSGGGFYWVDQWCTVYRRNYIRTAVEFSLSASRPDCDMVVRRTTGPQSGEFAKIVRFGVIAEGLDSGATLMQYTTKRAHGLVQELALQTIHPSQLHQHCASFSRVQFKTCSKLGSSLYKMAISKTRFCFKLYALLDGSGNDRVLVASLSSQVLVLRGKAQNYYECLPPAQQDALKKLLEVPYSTEPSIVVPAITVTEYPFCPNPYTLSDVPTMSFGVSTDNRRSAECSKSSLDAGSVHCAPFSYLPDVYSVPQEYHALSPFQAGCDASSYFQDLYIDAGEQAFAPAIPKLFKDLSKPAIWPTHGAVAPRVDLTDILACGTTPDTAPDAIAAHQALTPMLERIVPRHLELLSQQYPLIAKGDAQLPSPDSPHPTKGTVLQFAAALEEEIARESSCSPVSLYAPDLKHMFDDLVPEDMC